MLSNHPSKNTVPKQINQSQVTLLKHKNKAHIDQKTAQERFIKFIDKIQNEIQCYRIEALSDKLGIKPQVANSNKPVRITKRELDILYYLSLNKSPKDIAQIITVLENKTISDSTINAIINKKLYPKFDVFNVGQLIEKAIMLSLIPFLLDKF